MEMRDENITAVGYNSKKQAYIYLLVSVAILAVAILVFFFAEGNKKYASVGAALVAFGFLAGVCNLLKQPKIAMKVFDDRYIFFYDIDEEKQIDIHSITKVYYWPANLGLKITFVTEQGREHFAYLLENAKEVKEYLLDTFERNNITVVKKYSK